MLETERADITQARTKLGEQSRQIAEAKSKLPSIRSQEALRKTYTGIRGRESRKSIAGVESGLTAQERDIQRASEEVNLYEQEVNKAELEMQEQQRIYEEERRKAELYQGGQQFAMSRIDESGVIHGANLSGYPQEFIKGYNDAMQGITQQQSSYGGIMAVKEYGTELQKKRAGIVEGVNIFLGQANYEKVITPSGKVVLIGGEKKVMQVTPPKYEIIPETIEKPSGYLTTRKSWIQAVGETYKRNILESDRSDIPPEKKIEYLFTPKGRAEYSWKLLGITRGIISGTGEVVGKEVGSIIEKTGELAYKLGISEFKYAGRAEIQAGEILGKTTTEILPYAVPILGEGLAIGLGAESIAKGETTGEKVMGGVSIALGTYGLGVRALTKPTIITPPKTLNVKSQVEFGKLIKVEVLPRIKKLETLGRNIFGISKKAGGVRTTVSPTKKPTIKTELTGKNWKQTEIIQPTGEVSGEIETSGGRNIKQLFRRRDYVIKYKQNPLNKDIKYEVYIKTKGGLIKSKQKIEIQSGESQFGITEFLKKSKEKIQKTITTPSKEKIRTIEKNKVSEADIIKTGKSKYEIEDVSAIFKESSKEVTKVSPAERNIVVRQKFYEPKPIYKGEEVSNLKLIKSKKLVPKFAKSQPPDVERLVGIKAEVPKTTTASIEDITPRFEQNIESKASGEISFTLKRKNAFDKYIESNLIRSKKAQVSELQLFKKSELQLEKPLSQLEQESRLVNIGKPKIVEVSKPEMLKVQEVCKIKIGEQESVPLLGLGLNKVKQTKINEIGKSKDIIKVNQLNKVNEMLKVQQPQITNVVQKLKQQQKLNTQQIQKLRQIQELENIGKPKIFRESPRPPEPTRPIKTIEFNFNIPTEKKLSAKQQLQNIYEVIKVKGGKEQTIGQERNIFRAGKSLSKALKESLSASGFIKEKRTGRKLSYGEVANILGKEFTSGKKDITRIVQKRGFRLGTRSEVFKIQTAKKQKGGKIKWLK